MKQVLSGPLTFSSRQRVRKAAEFQQIKQRALKIHSRRLMLMVCASNPEQQARLGVIVTKKTGGAVVRNRWKRKLREYFRNRPEQFSQGSDYLLIVKSKTKGWPTDDVERELNELHRKHQSGARS
ncbi:MAG: ribonuclease P protein component [Bdellovibrionota bacterium]